MHSFGFYFRKGRELTKLVMKNKSFGEKVLIALYFLGSMFGKLFVFLRPIFLIGDMNIALMMNEGHDIQIEKVFEGVNDKKRYTSLLLSSLFIEIISFALLVVLVLPFVILNTMSVVPTARLVSIILMIVASIGVAVVTVILALTYAPMDFVATKGIGLSAGDLLFLGKKASKGNKGKIIGLVLIPNLIIYAIIGVLVGISIVLIGNMNSNPALAFLVIPVVILLLAIPVLEVLFFFRLKCSMVASLYALYDESIKVNHVVLAKRNASNFEEYVAVFTDDKEEK